MITNFALTLTYSGIDLLQRTDGGWRPVGSASLLSRDLAADLAALRAKGMALAPDGFFTKLVIPLEQIKYLAIDTTQTSDADIASTVDGTTPYALDELVIDCERSGGRTHIAVVAKETLQEAEVFAQAHGFQPVSFVAVPDAFTFQQEIFFGPTSCAATILGADATPVRDSLPVMLLGTRIKSQVILPDAPSVKPLQATSDLIIAEYYPALPAAPEPAPLPVPSAAAPAYFDRVIAEYHPTGLQEELPMMAVVPSGMPRPVMVGGAMPPPAARAANAQAFAMPAAIAAGIAVLGFALWGIYAPATPVSDLEAPAPVIVAQDGDATLPDIDLELPEAFGIAADTLELPPPTSEIAAMIPADGLIGPELPVARTTLPELPATDNLETDTAFVTPDNDDIVEEQLAADLTAGDETTLAQDATPADPVDLDAAAADDAADEGPVMLTERPSVVPLPRPETASVSADDAADTETAAQDTTAGGVALTGLQAGTTTATADATETLAPPPGAIRPRLRPALPETATNADAVNELLGGIAFAAPQAVTGGTEQAVAASLRPAIRPGNFDRVVANARSRQEPAPTPGAIAAAPAAAPVPATPAPEPAAAPAPPPPPPPAPPVQAAAPVAPQNYAPVPGGVARAATQDNAIRLREINLIGVYGQSNSRRALVRLGNGQYVRVQVGSELDGGQVTAIGENAINYVKRGTTYALQIPSG